MQDVLQQLEQIEQEASTALAQATSTEETEQWYSDYLGRKGQLTGALRNLGGLPKEERPKVGQIANQIKTRLEEALQGHQQAFAY